MGPATSCVGRRLAAPQRARPRSQLPHARWPRRDERRGHGDGDGPLPPTPGVTLADDTSTYPRRSRQRQRRAERSFVRAAAPASPRAPSCAFFWNSRSVQLHLVDTTTITYGPAVTVLRRRQRWTRQLDRVGGWGIQNVGGNLLFTTRRPATTGRGVDFAPDLNARSI